MAPMSFKQFVNVDYTQTGDGQLAYNAKKRKTVLIITLNPSLERNRVEIIDANGCQFNSPVYTIEEGVSPINITESFSDFNGYNIDCYGCNNILAIFL